MNGHGFNPFDQQVLVDIINVILVFGKNQHLSTKTVSYTILWQFKTLPVAVSFVSIPKDTPFWLLVSRTRLLV